MRNISNGIGITKISLKVKEFTQKYWAIVIGDCPLPMEYRLWLYIVGVVIGIILSLLLPESLLPFFPFYQDNIVFQSALAVFFLTFPLVTINWFIKNRDTSRQLKDSSQQLEYSSQQQNETLFSNSLQLLFKENNIIANSVGLKELVKLKQEGRIDPERIDLITSSGLQLEKTSLQRANLQGADIQRANLQGADIQRANLQGADIQRANLQGVNLRKANLQGVNLYNADLIRANLQFADIYKADLEVANLQEADLIRANLQDANLQDADLRGADLQEANLYKADLQGADLQRANLYKVNLQGAKLKRVKLREAKLELSLYNEMTQFPGWLDPKQRGMRLAQKQDE